MSRIVLQTSRLTLREMTRDDLDFVAEMLGDAEVMRFYPKVLTRDEAANWLERQLDRYARDGHGLWLVQDRRSGIPMGQVGLVLQTIEGEPEHEIGYLIHRPFWRQGYATEAAAGVRDLAFDTMGLTRLTSLVRPVNIPSLRTSLAIGHRPEKLVTFCDLEHFVMATQRPGA